MSVIKANGIAVLMDKGNKKYQLYGKKKIVFLMRIAAVRKTLEKLIYCLRYSSYPTVS